MSEYSDLTTDAIPIEMKRNIRIPEISTGSNLTDAYESDFYKMNHNKRGKALIFNHFTFDKLYLGDRRGTNKDAKDIERSLYKLGFAVHIYNDLKYETLNTVLNAVAKEDHTNNDCLVIIVMSHGDAGLLFARDVDYSTECLWQPFAEKNCTTLAGKPKLFFIQACRGELFDNGNEVTESDSAKKNYTIPAMPENCLVMYSTSQDHYSFRSPSRGSWFIQALCIELNARAKSDNLMAVLTFVNRYVSFKFVSYVPGKKHHDKKQVGSIVSGLTKLIQF